MKKIEIIATEKINTGLKQGEAITKLLETVEKCGFKLISRYRYMDGTEKITLSEK